jgi:hypothetical protein
MTITRPNTKPAFWWLFPWSYARTLHTAANALRALTDSQEQAIVLQKHIIADQSEEIANLRRRVEDLSEIIHGPQRSKASYYTEYFKAKFGEDAVKGISAKDMWELTSHLSKRNGGETTWEEFCSQRAEDIKNIKL